MVTPLGSLIFKKSRVVPGRLETVACGTVDRGDFFFFFPPIELIHRHHVMLTQED